jgi:hypothetical protein
MDGRVYRRRCKRFRYLAPSSQSALILCEQPVTVGVRLAAYLNDEVARNQVAHNQVARNQVTTNEVARK